MVTGDDIHFTVLAEGLTRTQWPVGGPIDVSVTYDGGTFSMTGTATECAGLVMAPRLSPVEGGFEPCEQRLVLHAPSNLRVPTTPTVGRAFWLYQEIVTEQAITRIVAIVAQGGFDDWTADVASLPEGHRAAWQEAVNHVSSAHEI